MKKTRKPASWLQSVVFFCSIAQGAMVRLAAPMTGILSVVPNTQMPKPTAPPALHRLLKRKDSTALVAPDRTCGFISGLPGAPYACPDNSMTCAFLPASTYDGAVACCDDLVCSVRLTCVDLVQVSSSSQCDDECMIDTFTTKCTDSASPFCNTISFSGDIFDYYCASSNVSTVREATTTYDGQKGRTFSELTLTDTSDIPSPTESSSSSTSTRSTTSSSSSGTSSPTSTSGGQDDGSSPPVGPIVGGVVGGLAVIGIIGLGILYFVRSQKKSGARNSTVQSGIPPPMGQQPTPNAHLSMYSTPDPNKASDQSYPIPVQQETYQGFSPTQQPYQYNPQQPYGQPVPQPGHLGSTSPSHLSHPSYHQNSPQ